MEANLGHRPVDSHYRLNKSGDKLSHIETIGDAVLYLGNALDIAPTLSRDCAVIADVPYGINANTKARSSKRVGAVESRHAGNPILQDFPVIEGDDKPFDPTVWLSYPEVILFGANYFCDRLPPSSKWLVFDKRRGNTSDDNADCEIAWTNIKGPARLFSHLWRGMVRDSETGQKKVHPTQKPIPLMRWCIEQVKAMTILDPYMGSGTTGVACLQLGRKFLGVEIDPVYFDTACRRIEAAIKVPELALSK